MSIRERLKLAYENVAYGADKTWSNELHSLQKVNLDLYVRESQLQQPINVDLRPRTVRDCIPNSKLAKYSNYEYNDSRELSYTASHFKPTKISLCFTEEFKNEKEREPWMLEEVDTLYKWYTSCHADLSEHKEKLFNEKQYLLKLQVSKDTIRKIWDARSYDSNRFMYRSIKSIKGEKSVLVYKSPAGQFYVSEYDDLTRELKEDYYEWFKDEFEIPSDLDHMNVLSNSFKKQSEKNENPLLDNQQDSVQHRRLYSAVLQGYSSNKIAPPTNEGQMTILKRSTNKCDKQSNEKLCSFSELGKKKPDEEVPKLSHSILIDTSISRSSFVSKSAQTTSSTNEVGVSSTLFSTQNKITCQSHQYDTSFQTSRFYTNNYLTNVTPIVPNQSVAARYRQSYVSNNYHYPSFYMFLQNSFQQQHFLQQPSFYNPLMLQRTAPTNYERTVAQRTLHLPVTPQYVVPSSNFIQNQYGPSNFQRFDSQLVKSKVKTKGEHVPSKRLRSSSTAAVGGNIKKTNDFSSCSSFKTGLMMSSSASTAEPPTSNEIDDLVSRTVDLVLEDVKVEKILPVSGSISDELERQALEQYTNSSDNVYQELERQAAEEYEDCSENYRGPPNCRYFFGGF